MTFLIDIEIRGYLDEYQLSRSLTKKTLRTYYTALGHFERFLKGDAFVSHLNDHTFNTWIEFLEKEGMKPITISLHRRCILAIWNGAYNDRLTDNGPGRIRRVSVPREAPVAWSRDEMKRLVLAARRTPGYFQSTGIKKSAFWEAFLRIGWDTGLRLGDLLTLKLSHVKGDRLVVVQSKNKIAKVSHLAQATIDAIAATFPPERELLLPWTAGRNRFFSAFRELTARADVEGTSRFIRRASATAVEAISPGSASRHLGHLSDHRLAERHYIDPRLLPPPVRPPLLD